MKFSWKTIGHESAKTYCEKTLLCGTISHATALIGPSKIGKFTFAQDFIEMIFCLGAYQSLGMNPALVPCGTCSMCRQFQKNNHPDLLIIPSNGEQGSISIGDIRSSLKFLTLSPLVSSKKILLIDQAHRLTYEASQVLLKTLEEPNRSSAIILISENPHLFLPTIRSRIRMIPFFPLRPHIIQTDLESKGAPKETAKELSKFCHGRVGFAFDLFHHSAKLDQHRKWNHHIMNLLLSHPSAAWISLPEVLPKKQWDHESVSHIFWCWISIFHDLLMISIGQEGSMILPMDHQTLTHIAQKGSPEIFQHCLEHICQISAQRNPFQFNLPFSFENLIMSLQKEKYA